MVTDEIIIYKSEDGAIKLDVLFSEETVWLTQAQMSELFQRDRTVITKHISNVFEDGELTEEGNVHFLHIANSDKPVKYYNLDVVISVGYRVKSPQGTQFRIWATQRLRDYIIKGFALNDERFKSGSSMNYFRELLERIREIRTEERVFYQQIKEIYKTSWDYDPEAQITLDFFAEIQNKLLWAVSGKTAAELRYYRANHTLPMMGLTSTSKAGVVRKSDITVGKNYLDKEELQALKLIVEQYLAFAESQALAHNKMSMRDWIDKLKLILTMNNRNILEHSGRISKELADKKLQKSIMHIKKNNVGFANLKALKNLIKTLNDLKSERNKFSTWIITRLPARTAGQCWRSKNGNNHNDTTIWNCNPSKARFTRYGASG